jgi:hypothetical protein
MWRSAEKGQKSAWRQHLVLQTAMPNGPGFTYPICGCCRPSTSFRVHRKLPSIVRITIQNQLPNAQFIAMGKQWRKARHPNPPKPISWNLRLSLKAAFQKRGGLGYLNRFSASISGVLCRVRLPSGGAAVGSRPDPVSFQGSNVVSDCCRSPGDGRERCGLR